VPDESSKLRTSYWVSFCSAVYAFLPHVISSHQLFPFAIEFRQLQKECTRHVKREGKPFKVDISWATMFNVQKILRCGFYGSQRNYYFPAQYELVIFCK
jgi:hypothetical protein